MSRYHLQPQSPQRVPQRRAFWLNITSCCSHSPENTHTHCCCHCQLLQAPPKCAWGSLWLLRTLQIWVAFTTFLQVLSTFKSPSTRHWLLSLPSAPFSLEIHSAPYPGDNSLFTLKKEIENIQNPILKINSNLPQNIKGLSCIEIALQNYSS